MLNLNIFNISRNLYNTASRWLFSTNHKDIGVMYIIYDTVLYIIKAILLLIRMELIAILLFSNDSLEESGTETISITNQDSVIESCQVPETELLLSNLTPKPKRGRPKKTNDLPKKTNDLGNTLDLKPKPKRGRPKKEKKN